MSETRMKQNLFISLSRHAMQHRIMLVTQTLIVSSLPLLASESPKVFTDPADAGAAFRLQGEYSGRLSDPQGSPKVSVQVIARGGNRFDAVGYNGELPGEGYRIKDRLNKDIVRAAGESKDDGVRFETEDGLVFNGRGDLEAGRLIVWDKDGTRLGELPRVERVSPTSGAQPPDGAIVLFSGDAENLRNAKRTEDALLLPGAITKDTFTDFRLHFEYLLPFIPAATGESRARSACILQGRYELRILDSFGQTGGDSECGGFPGLSGTIDESVNMSYPPLTWQTFDVYFAAAQWDNTGKKVENAKVTVRHNGVLIHENLELPRSTASAPETEAPGPGPIHFMDAGYPVRFRNIWIAPDWRPAQKQSSATPRRNHPLDALDRHAPLEPEEAVRSFNAIEGFRVELVAAEPHVADPVACAFDENSNLYVAELPSYPDLPASVKTPTDRIRLLRDLDGDGVFESSSVFVDAVGCPSGLAPWKGGLFVTAATGVWYFKDLDGDGAADIKSHIYGAHGLAAGPTIGREAFQYVKPTSDARGSERLINSLVWGIDNRIYGVGGGTEGGLLTPLATELADAEAVSIRGFDFSINPRTTQIEIAAGGGIWGHSFDDWGNRFICSPTEPILQVLIPAKYVAGNPWLAASPLVANIASEGSAERVYPTRAPEPWKLAAADIAYLRNPIHPLLNNKWGNGNCEDVITAATGLTVYRGDAYGVEFCGNAFVGDVAGNLIHRKVLLYGGPTCQAYRADQSREFLSSSDTWFRPTNLTTGPDGCLYVLDMCRETIEHPSAIPEPLLRQLDVTSGRGRGRIYRIVPTGGLPRGRAVRLGSLAASDLASLLGHPNAWHRETAQRLLIERNDRSVLPLVSELASTSHNEKARLHALYTLSGLDALSQPLLLQSLSNSSAQIRRHAVVLSEPQLQTSNKLLSNVLRLSEDPVAAVRVQVALSLGMADDARISKALATVLLANPGDEWVQMAVLTAANRSPGDLLSILVNEGHVFTQGDVGRFSTRLGELIGTRNRPAELRAALGAFLKAREYPASLRIEFLRAVAVGMDRSGASLLDAVASISEYDAEFRDVLEAAEAVARRNNAPSPLRTTAVDLLGYASAPRVLDVCGVLLSGREDLPVQISAVRAIGRTTGPAASSLLLDLLQRSPSSLRQELLEVILNRDDCIASLLQMSSESSIRSWPFDANRTAALLKHSEGDLRASLAQQLARQESANEVAREQFASAVSLAGDAGRGRVVFTNRCAACHVLDGRGSSVAPDLRRVGVGRSREELLLDIVAPDRIVDDRYLSYVVVLTHGRVVTGLISAESQTSLTLWRSLHAQETILREHIGDIVTAGKSQMPEGLLSDLRVEDVADLLAFVESLSLAHHGERASSGVESQRRLGAKGAD